MNIEVSMAKQPYKPKCCKTVFEKYGTKYETHSLLYTSRGNEDADIKSYAHHRDEKDGPAVIIENPDGCYMQVYYRHNIIHRESQPAIIRVTQDPLTQDRKLIEEWYRNGEKTKSDKVTSLSPIAKLSSIVIK